MSAGHTVTVTPSDAHVEVHLGGQLLATTDRALRLEETGLPARDYLPKDDVRMDLLRPTSFHTTCPFKGEASYWSADIAHRSHDGFVWAYESPIAAVAEIAGHVSFYPDRAEVTVNGQVPRCVEAFSSVLGAVASDEAPAEERPAAACVAGERIERASTQRCRNTVVGAVRRILGKGGVLCLLSAIRVRPNEASW